MKHFPISLTREKLAFLFFDNQEIPTTTGIILSKARDLKTETTKKEDVVDSAKSTSKTELEFTCDVRQKGETYECIVTLEKINATSFVGDANEIETIRDI